ncbi:MAG: 3-methyladenine DNA glycosylase [Verrucomicrobiaceae bacterium]
MQTDPSNVLSASTWQAHALEHRKQVEQITLPMRVRKSRHEKHPVLDFLHTYYSYSLGRLEKWHPGFGITLDADPTHDFSPKYYRRENNTVTIDPSLLTAKGRERLLWIHNLLQLTQSRPPLLACHGLHEWAMVYTGADIRHRGSAPLRLPQEEIDALVASRPVTCSHFDAFRFFAPDAVAFNKLSPTLLTREEHEQPGCIHANMDLYKWAYKSSPWISCDLLRETLFFAIEAREIDMRAAPYDLSDWGYPPIKVETPEGRREYERVQHALYLKALPLREKLISSLAAILATST